jgi:hypothetical protein
MKQTAIEWFTNQLEKHYVFQDIKNTTAFLHAKEMEKEQHKQTWLDSTAQFDNAAEMTYKKDFEQYYNERGCIPTIILKNQKNINEK